MARRRGKKSQVNRQTNAVLNPARRIPRPNLRGSVSPSTVLRGNEALFALNTVSTTGSGGAIYALVGGNGSNRVNSPIVLVSSSYSNCKYLPGTVFHYAPTVGTTTSGATHCCYVDNPEVLSAAYAALSTGGNTFNDFVRSQANSVTHAVWESFSLPINQVTSRKMYNVNATQVLDNTTSVDILERSCQGAFLICVEGGPNSVTAVGRPWLHTNIMLEGLRGTINT